jgi:protease-4
VAASGGYLAAAGADVLLAEPSTLTGSIGVFAVKPDLEGLLAKLGVTTTTFKRGQHADLQSFTRRWTDEERALVERELRSFYDLFVGRVADGRRMQREAVERAAQGQVWTGAQALERGLVDRLGTFEDAVELAARRAGLDPEDEPELLPLEPERGLLAGLASVDPASSGDGALAVAGNIPELRAASLLLELGPVVALPPGWVGRTEP